MNFFIDNFEYIVILTLIAILVVMFILVGFSKTLNYNFINKMFNVDAKSEIDVLSNTNKLNINIYNQNINDVRVTSFGFLYKNQNIDYTRMYLESKSLPYDHKIVISSRDLISFSSDIIILKDLVNDLNEGKTKISKIMVYATDNRGFTSSNRAKNIEKKIKEIVIKDIKNAKIKNQELTRLEKAELKDKKIRQKQIKKSERKEKISRFKLKLKSIFKRK